MVPPVWVGRVHERVQGIVAASWWLRHARMRSGLVVVVGGGTRGPTTPTTTPALVMYTRVVVLRCRYAVCVPTTTTTAVALLRRLAGVMGALRYGVTLLVTHSAPEKKYFLE